MGEISEALSAAALSGGNSRRMGADKAFLAIKAGGPPMLACVLNRLIHVADDVMVVANDRIRYEHFGARIVADVFPGGGALAGIHAAVSQASNPFCLVVACDMPFLSLPLLTHMAQLPRDFDVLIPQLPGMSRQNESGLVYQTLHAIYGKRCLRAMEARLAAGDRQVISFFQDVRVQPLDAAVVARFDPSMNSFFNANTPDSLAEARQLQQVEEHLAIGCRFES